MSTEIITNVWPENDYRYFLEHASGRKWKKHKYIAIKNGRYIYPSDKSTKSTNYGKGNVNLNNLPMIQNEDGTYETLDTFSVEIDGEQVLLNCIQMGPDGKAIRVTEDQAVDQYMKDGRHLGKFSTADAATEYAKKLDKDQEKIRSERLNKNKSDRSIVVVGRGGKEKGRYSSAKEAYAAIGSKKMSSISSPNVIYAPRKKKK